MNLEIKKGDVVDIIFPSNNPKLKALKLIKNYIKSLGLIPRILEEDKIKKADKDGFIIFSNKDKLSQLYKALSAKDSKLVWCWAGGYGSGELIQELQKKKKIKQKKFFIGFSDETFVTTFLQQKWNWQTLYAPMLSCIIVKKKSDKQLLDILFQKKSRLTLKLKLLNEFELNNPIKSKIVGGCLSILLASFGTKNQIKCKNEILFLEDVGEEGFRLVRKFNQIIDYIIDNKQYPKAILLGDFEAGNSRGGSNKKDFEKIVKKFNDKLIRHKINIPIFHNKTLGHSQNMFPLILGKRIVIDDKTLYQDI